MHETRCPHPLSLSWRFVCYFSLDVSRQNFCVLLSRAEILQESKQTAFRGSFEEQGCALVSDGRWAAEGRSH